MEKSSARPWDWLSAGLLFLLVQVAAARLVTTNWAPYLYFAEVLAGYGTVLGLALGASRYPRRTVIWFVIDYTVVLLPWQLAGNADNRLLLWDRLVHVSRILFTALDQFLQKQPVKDSFFFVAIVSLAFWAIALAAGYWLIRHANLLAAVIPPGIAILLVQIYDNFQPRSSWWLAVFVLLALLLLGRQYYLESQKEWTERRVFINDESWSNIFGGLFTTVTAAVVVAWMIPTSLSSLQAAADAWNSFTKPLRDRLSDAVSPLDAPYGSGGTNFYGETLGLGRNAAQGDSPVFTVQVLNEPDINARYYWRGHVYDFYAGGQWISTPASSMEFEPSDGDLKIPDGANRTEALLQFTSQLPTQGLLYSPSQPVWVSRPGSLQATPADQNVNDVLSWEADPPVEAGGRYQVRAEVSDPSVQQLRAAGEAYPLWVTNRYLEIPENIRPEIQALAEKITREQETPYDKAVVITNYLRANLQYSTSLAAPPEGRDPLLWVLFTSRKGFCNYYASAEVLMLRSVGVPARLAVGFAQGQHQNDTYIVRQRDAHAWPEVYFPGLGWVEFEPTTSQDALARPNAVSPNGTPNGSGLPRGTPISEGDEPGPRNPDEQTAAGSPGPFAQSLPGRALILGLSVLAAAVLIFLIVRYRIVGRLPFYLALAFERGGLASPGWVETWGRWNRLEPVERSFLAVNLSLRWLGNPPPLNATPAERARLLKKLLPEAGPSIDALTAELHSGLFTPRPADESRARRAGLLILLHALRGAALKLIGAADSGDVYSR
jgi:transglutaminase-like putative cysteine protease